MTCLHCKDSVRSVTSGYICQYCDLLLCRRWDCIKTHTGACQQEREAMMKDTAKIDAEERTYSEYSEARDRIQERSQENTL
jgi:hypothetical protein